jgi:MFS family permease
MDTTARPLLLDMNRTQWTVLFAAWLGWGFDCFDGLLFSFVAPTCVPVLLGLELGSQEARSATLLWTGVLSALLLIGWAIGGILFGRLADGWGRTRVLMLTMLLYSFGTAASAFAPNMAVLVLCRIVASLGIGGEWAAGASMVAEVVPEHRRVEAGALLYTAAPLGLLLAGQVTWLVQGYALPGNPEWSWRIVFLCGLFPAGIAIAVRWFVKEPERWARVANVARPAFAELFTPALRRNTMSGLAMALVALTMWWSCNAFIPVIANGLAEVEGASRGLGSKELVELKEAWKALSTNAFNAGGLLGTLLTIPVSKWFGRRTMFAVYFLGSAAALLAAFAQDLSPYVRLWMYFPIGLTVFGVFGSFTYYLPELFPTRLRSSGAGLCYNAGRLLAAFGPFAVGAIASRSTDALPAALAVLAWVAVAPLVGLVLLPFIVETKDRPLED